MPVVAALCTFGRTSLAAPLGDVALCGRDLFEPSLPFTAAALPELVDMREQSDWDLRSGESLEDFFVGEVTGRRGFLMVGDFLGDKLRGSCLEVAFEGEVFDFDGGLAAGLGPLAFMGELELRPGGLLLDEGVSDRGFSRSLRNLGRTGFLGDLLWSVVKLISHARPSCSWLGSFSVPSVSADNASSRSKPVVRGGVAIANKTVLPRFVTAQERQEGAICLTVGLVGRVCLQTRNYS